MKYANYEFCGKHLNNIGDQIQIIAIDYIYSLLGINRNDIVYINKDDLSVYNGEEVILPVSMPLVEYKEHGIADFFSKKISPVFLGLTLVKDTLSAVEISYYRNYEPVGCRDERTYNTLSKYGIKCYLGGCITTLLPERKKNPERQRKVFIIDPTESVIPYLPKELEKNAVWDTHMLYDLASLPKEVAKERYHKYFNEAKLVITSLLHCAVPCMAYGIPVILAKDVVSYRFAWLEKLLRIYTPKEYSEIDWNPQKISYDPFKRKLMKMVKNRLSGINNMDEISQIHEFYMNREKKEYVIDAFISLQMFIDKKWLDHEKEYKYAIWGLTQTSELTVEYIRRRYPNAKLCHVYDQRYNGEFEKIKVKKPELIELNIEETVFVTAVSAKTYAQAYFKKIRKPPESYAMLEIII